LTVLVSSPLTKSFLLDNFTEAGGGTVSATTHTPDATPLANKWIQASAAPLQIDATRDVVVGTTAGDTILLPTQELKNGFYLRVDVDFTTLATTGQSITVGIGIPNTNDSIGLSFRVSIAGELTIRGVYVASTGNQFLTFAKVATTGGHYAEMIYQNGITRVSVDGGTSQESANIVDVNCMNLLLFNQDVSAAGGGVSKVELRDLGSVPALSARYLADNFTGADNTILGDGTSSTHAPDLGSAWVQANISSGTKDIVLKGSAASFDGNGGTGTPAAYSDTGVADCTITADYIAGSSNGIYGVMHRYTSSGNTFFAALSQNLNQIIIYEWTSSVLTARASASFTAVAGTRYAGVIELVGNVHTFRLNDTKISYTTAVRNTVTKHGGGLVGGTSAGAALDNYNVIP